MRIVKSLTLEDHIYSRIEAVAQKRGTTIQEYIRVIIIPTYFNLLGIPKKQNKSKRFSLRVKKGWETRRKKAEAEELRVKNEEFPPYPAGPQQ